MNGIGYPGEQQEKKKGKDQREYLLIAREHSIILYVISFKRRGKTNRPTHKGSRKWREQDWNYKLYKLYKEDKRTLKFMNFT